MKEEVKYIKCVEVEFGGYGKRYSYKCPFENVEIGDTVEVPVTIRVYDKQRGIEETTEELKKAIVVNVRNYTEEDKYFAFQWMKTVTNVIENKLRRLRKTNPQEVLDKIDAIKDLDKEVYDYCINKLNYSEELLKLRPMGTCHLLWGAKKTVLKEKYNIDWLTPAECYPDIIFD